MIRNGVAQPDDREHRQGGDEEACMAVLNNFYGDGFYHYFAIPTIFIQAYLILLGCSQQLLWRWFLPFFAIPFLPYLFLSYLFCHTICCHTYHFYTSLSDPLWQSSTTSNEMFFMIALPFLYLYICIYLIAFMISCHTCHFDTYLSDLEWLSSTTSTERVFITL